MRDNTKKYIKKLNKKNKTKKLTGGSESDYNSFNKMTTVEKLKYLYDEILSIKAKLENPIENK
jgi:hypothetical protein